MRRLNLKLFLFAVIVFTTFSCNDTDDEVEPNWVLTWSDEFNGTTGQLPDATKWTYDLGGGGWGNNELETYTNSTSNISMDGNGHLVITAKSDLTSARIKTKDLFEQQYGKIEASIKVPAGTGMWPAFWMLGSDIDTNTWPGCGEIDIMETKGNEPTVLHGTIHGPGYSGGSGLTSSYTLTTGRFDSDYHLFAIQWSTSGIKFYVDNLLYAEKKPSDAIGKEWVFDKQFFIILNLAIGGNFVGNPAASAITLPKSMYVDYVRVYTGK